MPRASRRKPTSERSYVAWDSASLGSLPGALVVRKGMRVRGDDPRVKAAPWLFIPDAGDDDANARAISERWVKETQPGKGATA